MPENIQKRLIALFDKVTDKDMKFEKKMYPKVFAKVYDEYQEIFEEIAKLADESEDRELFVRQIADYIPAYAEEKIDMSRPRRKIELSLVDYNMGMAIFVLPLMNYHPSEVCKQVSERMVSVWNEKFSTQLKNASYEQISAGFKQRLCYITTAVCENFGKSDNCYELETLRTYRDQYLLEEKHGVELVQEYYNVAPTIVKHINRLENRSEVYQGIWKQYLQPCIQLIECNQKEACKEVYSNMVRELQKQYLYS